MKGFIIKVYKESNNLTELQSISIFQQSKY